MAFYRCGSGKDKIGGGLADGYTVPSSSMYYLGLQANMVQSNISNNHINFIWTKTGSSIGASADGQVNIAPSIEAGVTKLKYQFNATFSYDKDHSSDVRPLIIGVTNTLYKTDVYTDITHNAGSNSYFAKCVDYRGNDDNNYNTDIEGEIDLTDLDTTKTIYILIVATGWDVTIKELSLY